ncbi:MAG: hypothetical protein R3250_06235 [Melioribacteraceae bacterium]|nr:hypothetical protein [Melioribacteraceae bacterium]
MDDQNIPQKIQWKSEEGPQANRWLASKAMAISFFDKEHKDTYKLDLWTKDMQVGEMDRFMYNTLKGLAETYFKATHNHQLFNDMQSFVEYFGKQTKILTE